LFVIEVKNWSGIIELKADGVWSQVRRNGTIQNHPDVVEETKHRANLLKFYIEKRGVTLPPSFVQPKVFLVNPDCRYIVFSTTYLPLFFQQDFVLDFVPLVLVLTRGGFGKHQA
jgi:hypothetical protein